MENVFVWEHLQTFEAQSQGAWLGMNFNPKGGCPVWGRGRTRPQAVGEMPATISGLGKGEESGRGVHERMSAPSHL